MKRCTLSVFILWILIISDCPLVQCKAKHQSKNHHHRRGELGNNAAASSADTSKEDTKSSKEDIKSSKEDTDTSKDDAQSSSETFKLKMAGKKDKPVEYFKQKSSKENLLKQIKMKDDCWVGLNAKWLFHNMKKLDAKYADVRREYHQAAENAHFDDSLLKDILNAQGEAQRAVHSAIFQRTAGIPRGINLGGRCMIRLTDSVLFFHRLKVQNDTNFRIDYLHSDMVNMTLQARLSLHDLHLTGSYERALTDQDPSNLFYRPTYSELNIVLKNVQYKMEGRYRLLKDQLVVEMVISDIQVTDVLMMYKPNITCPQVEKLDIVNVDKLLGVIRSDLDMWLKDYFNDYLRYYGLAGIQANKEFQAYDMQKAGILNRFVDQGLETLKNRMRQLKAINWRIPGFSVFSVNGMQIRLKNGILRGLDTLHRRSVATGRIENDIRFVDAIVGFGKLRFVYEYEAMLTTGSPPVTGLFVMACDQLTAKLSLSMVKEPETAELSVYFYQQLSEETLTVEGPINRMIGSYKHILENHIMTLMFNIMVHHIKLLGRLTRCEPNLPGFGDDDGGDGEDSVENLDEQGKAKVPCIPETELQNAFIGFANADSVEFDVPSDKEEGTHRKKMHMKYNERLAIVEITTVPPPTKRGDYDIRLSREDTVEIEMPDGRGNMIPRKIKYWEGAALGKNPKGPKPKRK